MSKLHQRLHDLSAALRAAAPALHRLLPDAYGWRRLFRLSILGMVGLGALLVAYLLLLIPLTPSIKDLKQVRGARASVILTADGQELGSFEQGLQERIPLKQMSPLVIQALIATEDQRFYAHHGVDFYRTAAAMVHTAGGDAQGGSTITQQLARNLFPEEIGRSRTLNRKLKELVTALKIERTYSKDDILETYLNTVPFLYNTFGIEMAARTYFNKPAEQLDVLESATLVGMLKGTSYYNPVASPQRSIARRNVVLGQLRKQDLLTQQNYQELCRRPLRVYFNRQQEKVASDGHFAAYVRKWLIDWADANDYNLQLDGLVARTTLDSALQRLAVQAVQRQADALQSIADAEWSQPGLIGSTTTDTYTALRGKVAPFRYFWESHGELARTFLRETPEYRSALDSGATPALALAHLQADGNLVTQMRAAKSRLEAGFVALDPASGQVRAWVGSRDFARDQFDHVAQAARQPGSTFKPLVYGAALEKGLSPEKPYLDAVVDIRVGPGKVWRPTDMSGSSGMMIPMRDGLVFSKNTITAQVMRDTGLPNIIRLARAMGINQSKLEAVPSLALGTSPVTLLEMVSAYATIAAQGQYRAPAFITRITDRSGKVIAEFSPKPSQQAMSKNSADQLVAMLRGVIDRGTGTGIRTRFGITADVAGKTGTTQNNTDGWFMLMHPNLVAGAWVGFNDNRVTMRSSYWGQGGHNAIFLVGDFFRDAIATGKVDPAAQFPHALRSAPVKAQAPVEEVQELQDEPADENQAPEEIPWPEAPPDAPRQQRYEPTEPAEPPPPEPVEAGANNL